MSTSGKTIYVTLGGLPLSFKFDWPFHASGSGADFHVLHSEITLESSDGLRALVAVNLSATLREILPSLDPKDTEAPIINALRKDVDRKQIEFVKSGKLVPLPFSSRHYDFRRNKCDAPPRRCHSCSSRPIRRCGVWSKWLRHEHTCFGRVVRSGIGPERWTTCSLINSGLCIRREFSFGTLVELGTYQLGASGTSDIERRSSLLR